MASDESDSNRSDAADRFPLWTRREVLGAFAGAALVPRAPRRVMFRRTIPSSGESLAAVGMGTWRTFDVGEGAERDRLLEVLRRFVALGGELVDASPMYGRSEAVVGDLSRRLGVTGRLFHATKVWTEGRDAGVEQMERSFSRFGVRSLDLIQVHNLVDWRTHLETLRAWKARGRIRYTGVTHYRVSTHDDLERVLAEADVDFVQVNYNVATRAAEDRLIPFAADRGVGVIVNRPYREGALFRAVRGRDLPGWARSFCETWGQFFLKYVLANRSVTCVIPATSDPEHMSDNMGAGTGRLPTAAERRRMADLVDAL